VLSYHKHSVQRALLDLFPDIGLDQKQFDSQSTSLSLSLSLPAPPLSRSNNILAIWLHSENRRNFFENYANYYKFNPHEPSNWYSQSREQINAEKVSEQL
jgi:hypothetical protein